MAFLNIDPTPMMLAGYSRVVVQGRVPYVRMVTPRALPRNEDLAIVSVPPELHGELNFAELRERVLDLLVDHYGLRVRDVQRCPFGRNQAFVRLARVSDRDSLVNLSPHLHQGLSFQFVNHNRGRNARRVNFNRECWLMLIGYPEDYRTTDEIADTIKSFARIILWQKDNVLGRVIVKARVTDLTDVPHYIVISEGDDFEGVSLTVQCEIMQQNLLGEGPPDEDIPPGGLDDGFIFPGIGLGLNNQQFPGHQELWAPGHMQHNLQQIEGNQPLDLNLALPGNDNMEQPIHDGGGNAQGDQQAVEGNIQGEQPENVLAPEGGNVQISMSINQGSSIFSSSDSSEHIQIPDLNFEAPEDDPMHAGQMEDQFLEILLAMPAQPADPMMEDAQIEDLMEIQGNHIIPAEEILEQPLPEVEQDFTASFLNVNLNLNVGFVTIRDQMLPDFEVPTCMGSIVQTSKPAPDLYRLWAKHFAPMGLMQQVVDIPRDWASFFLVMLLSPGHFEWAKAFLASKTWETLLSCSKEAEILSFAIPMTCPKDAEVFCSDSMNAESALPDEEMGEEEIVTRDSTSPKKSLAVTFGCSSDTPLVVTDVRRSLRLSGKNGGFRKSSCTSKGCLACSASPPAIPMETIKKIGESVCMIAPGLLNDEVLKKKSKARRPIGEKKVAKKPALHVKGKGKEKLAMSNEDTDEE